MYIVQQNQFTLITHIKYDKLLLNLLCAVSY